MKINEIFYSLQGEGFWTGTPAVFVRFSGCNLKCPFCDTLHYDSTEYTEEEIARKISEYPGDHVIFTGGEPTLQLTRTLADTLHSMGKYLHIETNGSIALTDGLDQMLDWITVSPKQLPLKIQRIDELKVLYHGAPQEMSRFEAIPIENASCRFLQPCDVNDPAANAHIVAKTIEYIKRHPQWRLSLQIHKLLGIR